MRRRVPLIALGVLVSTFAARAAAAQEFKPFTEVHSVCPTCEPERFDRLTLASGVEVRAWIVAELPGFYVLERFGELRAVGRDQVTDVVLSPQRSADDRRTIQEAHRDQVLLDDGSVYSGVIEEQRPDTGLYRLRSAVGGVEHLLFRTRIARVIRAGAEVAIPR